MGVQKRSHHATLLSVDCQSVRAGGCGGAEAQRLGWCRRRVFEQQNEGILLLLQLAAGDVVLGARLDDRDHTVHSISLELGSPRRARLEDTNNVAARGATSL